MIYKIAVTGNHEIKLPQWGRSFWKDPVDGVLFLAYASGDSEVDYITSIDDGETWSEPSFLFPVEEFGTHNNFDVFMDRRGHLHCIFRWNGSGCYQFVGKDGTDWDLGSGIGPCGLVGAGDSGNVKGIQGSCVVQEAEAFFDTADALAARMVVKDDQNHIIPFYVNFPYNAYPTVDPISDSFIGEEGGFPLVYIADDSPTVAFYDSALDSLRQHQFFFGSYSEVGSVPRRDTLISERIFLGTNIGWASGTPISSHAIAAIVCTESGQEIIFNNSNEFPSISGFLSETSATDNWRIGPDDIDDLITNFENPIIPTGEIWGVGQNTWSPSGTTIFDFPGEATNCDLTFDGNGNTLLYFQKHNEYGRQSIGRIVGKWNGSSYIFNEAYPSGLRHIAEVSSTTTGGFNNILFWGGFKALKYAVEPTGETRSELLVTQGWTSTYPSGGALTVWDVQNSPGMGRWQQPEYSFDYTATSGTDNPIFVGIVAFDGVQISSHRDVVANMFDGDPSTNGLIRRNYGLTIELDRERAIDKLEILVGKNFSESFRPEAPTVIVSGSYDNVNYNRVAVIPSGRINTAGVYNNGSSLIKYQSNTNETIKSFSYVGQPENYLEPFSAKYLRFFFDTTALGSVSTRIYEIRISGPGATYETITSSNSLSIPPNLHVDSITRGDKLRTESFRGQQGGLPAGWRTYGDFTWSIVGSGESTRQGSELESLPDDSDGRVESGIYSFFDTSKGKLDGYALRSEAIGDASGLGNPLGPVPIGGIQPGHSGVVEVDVNLYQDELPRTISFYLRSDIHFDDVVEFYTVSPIDPASGVLQFSFRDSSWSKGNPSNPLEPEREPHSVELYPIAGTHTLRWVYRKGDYDNPSVGSFGAAWIDLVTGLDPLPRNARYGYLRAVLPYATGAIHGYLNASFDDFIYGYLEGAPWTSTINGFVLGEVGSSGIIYGYVDGTDAESKIHGYVLSQPDEISTEIYGYLHSSPYAGITGVNQSSINSYLNAVYGSDGSIHGYLFTPNGNISNIHGFLYGDSGNLVWTGDTQSVINGYVYGPVGEENSQIHGYLINSGEYLIGEGAPGLPNKIYGYVQGGAESGTFNPIHGYVLGPDGGLSSIHGYVAAGKEDVSINGYLSGYVDNSGAIHAYLNSVGFNDQQVLGYVFGISGIVDNQIHGYLVGHTNPSSMIIGTLIGSPSGSSSSPCSSHGFPLPSVGTITIPTNLIN